MIVGKMILQNKSGSKNVMKNSEKELTTVKFQFTKTRNMFGLKPKFKTGMKIIENSKSEL